MALRCQGGITRGWRVCNIRYGGIWGGGDCIINVWFVSPVISNNYKVVGVALIIHFSGFSVRN